MSYVDGFVLVVPKKSLKEYKAMAKKASKIWRDNGALEYRECVGDDLKVKKGMGISFNSLAKTKKGEMVVFAWIVYKSRDHRNETNKKVMKDPRMDKMIKSGKEMPFDCKRMAYGGFDTMVDA
jgi:uncharacterized protein YbaA (DUF1428 family)